MTSRAPATALRRPTRQARRARRDHRGAHRGHGLRESQGPASRSPLGEVELLSTHDQLLGRTQRPKLLGCRFPANPGTRPRSCARPQGGPAPRRRRGPRALRARLRRGARRRGEWETYAIEINLRKGGTTHPFLTLQFLTDGRTTPRRPPSRPAGRRSTLSPATMWSPDYRGLTPDDLFDIVARHGLHFDHARQTGVVFHMIGEFLTELGRAGLAAVGDSPADADARYRRPRRNCSSGRPSRRSPLGTPHSMRPALGSGRDGVSLQPGLPGRLLAPPVDRRVLSPFLANLAPTMLDEPSTSEPARTGPTPPETNRAAAVSACPGTPTTGSAGQG